MITREEVEEQFRAELNELLLKWSAKDNDGSFTAAEIDAWEQRGNAYVDVEIPGLYNELGKCYREPQCITLGQSVEAKELQ